MIRKCLAIGIILLFVGVTIAPTINAQDNDKSILLDSIPITVLEYKSDGTVERTVVRMSSEQANSYNEEMANTQDLDTKLSIYKKYNLISQDVTVDTLRTGMHEKAQKMGITQNKLECMIKDKIKNNLPFINEHKYINYNCTVEGYAWNRLHGVYLLIPFGESIYTYFINNDGSPGTMKSNDFLDIIIGHLSFYSYKGLLDSISVGHFFGIIIIKRFVGYMFHAFSQGGWGELWFFEGFCGKAEYVKATGFFN